MGMPLRDRLYLSFTTPNKLRRILVDLDHDLKKT